MSKHNGMAVTRDPKSTGDGDKDRNDSKKDNRAGVHTTIPKPVGPG